MEPPATNLAWWAQGHFATLRWCSFALCLSPALWLAGEWQFDALGVNPLNRLLHFTGRCALVMLGVALAVTPMRRFSMWASQAVHARFGKRISDWNWLIRLRRQFGLFTFFYAGLHSAIYLGLDVGFDFAAAWEDVQERPFIFLGLAAFAMLVPLALTSTHFAMRALGRRWRQLHTLAYGVAVMAVLHFVLQAKVGDTHAWPYAAAVALLLGLRLWAWLRGERSAAAEVKER